MARVAVASALVALTATLVSSSLLPRYPGVDEATQAMLEEAARVAPRNPEDPSVQSILELPTAWAAMMLCSGVFVAGLPFEVVFDEDCDFACSVVNATVDYTERSVVATLLSGDWPYKSIWRGDGIGCTVVDGMTEAELRAQNIGDQSALPALNASQPWPLGEALSPRDPTVDWAAVEAAVEEDFACVRCNTRAVTISYKGQLMYERYRTETGVSASTRLLGWSSTKSVTSALVGVLVNDGLIDVNQRVPVPE